MADDLTAYLNALPDKLANQLGEVVREQAELLSAAQRQALQSLEQSDETGDLEASCIVTPGETDLEYIVQAGGALTTKEVREGSGVAYDYADAFEFGTSRQAARPFFWPTYREHKEQLQQAIDQAVNEVLDQ